MYELRRNVRRTEKLREQKHEFEDLSKKVIGCAIEVHKALGPGFLENIYEQAFKIELNRSDIEFEAQKGVEIEYLGHQVGSHRLDLVVENSIVVELKAAKELLDIHFAQLRSYLKATGLQSGTAVQLRQAGIGNQKNR